MAQQKKIVAIVPAHNEARAIEGVIDDLQSHGVQPLVVDDGSTDATRVVAVRKGVMVVSHLLNRGQGASLQTGMKAALKLNPDCIVHFDADGQHQAKDIASLTAPIFNGSAAVTLGSRFLKTHRVPFLRHAVLKLAILYTRLTTGLQLTDTHNGLRAFSPKAAEAIIIRQSGMAHASEILDQIAEKELAYQEVPVDIRYSEYSLKKGQRLSNSFSILFDLWFK